MKRKLSNGLEYYESKADWKNDNLKTHNKKIKIILIIITIIIIFSGFTLIHKKNALNNKIDPLKENQEYAIHQTLADLLKDYYGYYEIEPLITSYENNILSTSYSVKVGDKTFNDCINVNYSIDINPDNIFTESNKNNFLTIVNYANSLKKQDQWNDLEEKMVSISIEFIKSQLSYSNNADFGGANLEKVYDNEDGSGYYQVKGKVTAMNAFGAKIKYNYVVSINITNDLKQYEIIDFNIF